MTDQFVIGERVRQARLQRGLSQEALGELAGMYQSAIARLERGRCVPRPKTVQRLATALGVSPWLLLLGTDDADPDESRQDDPAQPPEPTRQR